MELADLTRGMRKNDFLEPEKLFFDCLAYGIGSQDPIAQLVARWAKDLGSGAQFSALSFGPGFLVNNVPGPDWKHSKHARKKNNFSELEKLIFCKASVFFKLLKKTIFQIPKSTHILILCGLEAVQACAKKKTSLKSCFSAKTRHHPIRPYKGSRHKK